MKTKKGKTNFREPWLTQSLRLVWRLTGKSRSIDRFFGRALGYRDFLPKASPEDCIPEFLCSPVTIRQGPLGAWATPLPDTFVLLKAAVGFRPRTILEIGSYLGATAKLLAENTSEDCRIFALDLDEKHGEAYRDSAVARKITRLVGEASEELAAPGAPYDMIFIDGDHGRDGALHDSWLAWHLLSDRGVIFWHDYQLRDYFVHSHGAVPEALREFQAKTKAKIVSLAGTMLAFYSRYPGWETLKIAK